MCLKLYTIFFKMFKQPKHHIKMSALMLPLLTEAAYYWGENKHLYGPTPPHLPLKTTNCLSNLGSCINATPCGVVVGCCCFLLCCSTKIARWGIIEVFLIEFELNWIEFYLWRPQTIQVIWIYASRHLTVNTDVKARDRKILNGKGSLGHWHVCYKLAVLFTFPWNIVCDK